MKVTLMEWQLTLELTIHFIFLLLLIHPIAYILAIFLAIVEQVKICVNGETSQEV